jgi:glyoxylase-like metal-dependent hydrolase (beta-lactamase superfamily II)
MIFRQLFEPISCTYTYLVACGETGHAVLIDPVLPAWRRDLDELQRLELKLVYTIDTHIHADHITAAATLKREAGSLIAHPSVDGLPCIDTPIEEGHPIEVGGVRLEPLFTPGHTDGHHAYRVGDRVFTGDALLIDACGRTDFQNGDARTLYHSIHQKLFALDDDTLVFPGHDYEGRRVSSVGQEKTRNPRLGSARPRDEFVGIMDALDLPYPKFIDFALPGNRQCGVCPPNVPDNLQAYCDQIGESQQG